MILESVRVENFKCIDDSTEFSIRSLTGLVGQERVGQDRPAEGAVPRQPDPADRGARSRTPNTPGAGGPPTGSAGTRRRTGSSRPTWRLEDADIAAIDRGARARTCWPARRWSSARATTTGSAGRSTSTSGGSSSNLVRGGEARRGRAAQPVGGDDVGGAAADAAAASSRRRPAQAALLADVQQRFPRGDVRRAGHRRCSRRGCRGSCTSPSTTGCPPRSPSTS